MLFGAHVSASGGVSNAPKNAAALGLECFQFFSRPPHGGKVGAITEEEADAFRASCAEHGFKHTYIHAPYIINMASSEDRIRHSTISILRGELDRGSVLGVTAMMFHPGSAKGVGEEKGMELVVDGIKMVLEGYEGTTRLLIEVSAGAGMVMGDQFEEVAEMLDGVKDERVGVCFDTAHAFASGYDLRTKEAVTATMKKFDKIIGLKHLEVSHCNDSMVELGAHKDRHQHIGQGYIGLSGFEAIVGSKAFKNVNLILETPTPEGVQNDLKLLKKFRG